MIMIGCGETLGVGKIGIFDTYSKRKAKRERAGEVDIYKYDEVPEKLRNQVIHILNSALGPYYRPTRYATRSVAANTSDWEAIHQILCRELGVFCLSDNEYDDPKVQCLKFLKSASVDHALDLIELAFKTVENLK